MLRAVAQDERSQLRNRELALERLVEALREALRVPRRAGGDEAIGGGARAAAARRSGALEDEAAAHARLDH